MAKGNFEACALITLGYEGGYSNDRRDPGNWTGGKVGIGVLKGTNMGIAANTYPNLDIKNLKKADVLPLYKGRYWDGVRGDDLPFGVDLAVYDYGVNSGPSRGVKALQKAVGATVDGKMGNDTIVKAARAASDGKRVIQAICAGRMSFLRGLSTWATFKGGWSKRVANVEARAVSMFLANTGKGKPAVASALETEADKATALSKKQTNAAHSTVAGGATGGVVVDSMPSLWLIAVAVVAVVVVAGVLYVKARNNKERAKAYEDEAAAV